MRVKRPMGSPEQPTMVIRDPGLIRYFVANASYGERITYYLGEFLPEDDTCASILREAHRQGRVILFRKRVGEPAPADRPYEHKSFEYIAQRTARSGGV